MTGGVDRWVVLGLAPVRSSWCADVTRWSSGALIPVEFVKCVGPADLRARLTAGDRVDAVLADGTASTIGRPLIDEVRRHLAAIVVVDDDRTRQEWLDRGATDLLPIGFGPNELLEVLAGSTALDRGRPEDRPEERIGIPQRSPTGGSTAAAPSTRSRPRDTSAARDPNGSETSSSASTADAGDRHRDHGARPAHRPNDVADEGEWLGTLIAVTGSNGGGASTTAMALAQGMGRLGGNVASVVLADLAVCGDQSMYHDVGDVIPAVQELADAHRSGRPSRAELRRHLFDIDERGYALLLGLRRPRDWAAMTPATIEATITSLRAGFRVVVADVRCELDGEAETGAAAIGHRHALARAGVGAADVVVVCGDASLKGLHGLIRAEHEVLRFGVAPRRIIRVVTRAGRSPRRRAELTATLDRLGSPALDRVPPVFVPERRHLDVVHSTVAPLPAALVTGVTAAVDEAVRRVGGRSGASRRGVR